MTERRPRGKGGFPPRSVIAVVFVGLLLIAIFGQFDAWWERAVIAGSAVYLAATLIMVRKGKIGWNDPPRVRQPRDRRRYRPEVWKGIADRFGFEFDAGDGDRVSMSGHWRFVPVALSCNRKGERWTLVVAKPSGVSPFSLRATPRKGEPKAGGQRTGDPEFDAAYRARASMHMGLGELLGERVREFLLALGDVEVECMWRTVTLRTRGFEADPDRIRALLEIAAEVSLAAQALSAPSSDEEE